MPPVHKAEVFYKITLKKGEIQRTLIAKFACGAKTGDGFETWHKVTCPKCKDRLIRGRLSR